MEETNKPDEDTTKSSNEQEVKDKEEEKSKEKDKSDVALVGSAVAAAAAAARPSGSKVLEKAKSVEATQAKSQSKVAQEKSKEEVRKTSVSKSEGTKVEGEEGEEKAAAEDETDEDKKIEDEEKPDTDKMDDEKSFDSDAVRKSASLVKDDKKSLVDMTYEHGSKAPITSQRGLSIKAKTVVGSIISFRKYSSMEGAEKGKSRYMNTYKLYSDNPFNPERVQKILENVMIEALEDLVYDVEKCPKQAKWAAQTIRNKIKELEYDRYKLICIVTIGERNSQDILVTSRFLWDPERDRHATFVHENTHVFGVAQCFGLYYE